MFFLPNAGDKFDNSGVSIHGARATHVQHAQAHTHAWCGWWHAPVLCLGVQAGRPRLRVRGHRVWQQPRRSTRERRGFFLLEKPIFFSFQEGPLVALKGLRHLRRGREKKFFKTAESSICANLPPPPQPTQPDPPTWAVRRKRSCHRKF